MTAAGFTAMSNPHQPPEVGHPLAQVIGCSGDVVTSGFMVNNIYIYMYICIHLIYIYIYMLGCRSNTFSLSITAPLTFHYCSLNFPLLLP